MDTGPGLSLTLGGPTKGKIGVEAPLPFDRFPIRLISPKVAMMDAGIAWLFESIATAWRVANAA